MIPPRFLNYNWPGNLIPLPSGIFVNAPRLLFYDQNRAGSQLNDSVSATSEHSLIQRRMAGSPDHQEISTEFTGGIDDASHGVTDKHMGLQPHILFRCHCFGTSAHSCTTIGCVPLVFDLADQFRKTTPPLRLMPYAIQTRFAWPGRAQALAL
jgi:hypothetical protein